LKSYRFPLLAAVFFLLGGASIVRTRAVRETAPPPLPPPASPYEATVGGLGIVEASSENIAIGAPVSGLVLEVPVTVGNRVVAGEPLFRIDDRIERARLVVDRAAVEAAEANVAALRAALGDLENQWRIVERIDDPRAVSVEQRDRRRFAFEAGRARLAQAEADLETARAQVAASEVDVARRVVRAPVDGTLLQVKVRAGEYAQAALLDKPLMLLGATDPLHVRVDVDEQNAWRVTQDAPAVARIRGNATLEVPLEFVRVEPYVVPKRSLTGDPSERVDTRVLQVVYRAAGASPPMFVGQQVDVFISAGKEVAG
jgi:HlyD family secretion protein